MMVILRCCQGAFGAALIPLSQAILKQSFPLEKQGKAMAIWGLGVMVAPVLGPTLGGIITEHASWRWVFYINTPICIAAIILAMAVIPKTKGTKQSIDWVGILLMFVTIGSLQLFLDQGNNNDWLNSNFITSLLIICIIAMILFVWHTLSIKKPAINIRIFRDNNFKLSTLCLAIFCGTQFSLLILEPIMMQTLFNYTAIISGLTLMPMGLMSGVSVSISANLMNRIKIKYILLRVQNQIY